MRENTIIVYGSYGYTGKLIVNELRQKKYNVILAGRNHDALQKQFNETGYPFVVVDISDSEALKKLLLQATLVIHCGGPFRFTAKQMVDACIETKTHYTDITGEWQVFELLAGYDEAAKQAGVQLMPGTGFDVVPSDCLAVHLKQRLSSATHLQLAFAMVPGGMSRGTKKSMTESLGHGGIMRKGNELVPFTLGKDVLDLDFGKFTAKTTRIQWGDISTAWRSTGIPTIEVFAGADEKAVRSLRLSNYLGFLLRKRWMKDFMLKQIDKGKAGPSEDHLLNGKCYLRGTVWDAAGNIKTSLFNGPNAYLLTAKTAVLIAEKVMNRNFHPGYKTPAMEYGADLVLEVAGTERKDLS
ncbi:MAG: saccharopine dehydrogenase NADP-binding domain-containing protein [Cyclobacteriaceae bacterium]|nr:saccharopine dehydrogenase NADP-binding domain-containing protein [Cyclobacteriaceae bacterium]